MILWDSLSNVETLCRENCIYQRNRANKSLQDDKDKICKISNLGKILTALKVLIFCLCTENLLLQTGVIRN